MALTLRLIGQARWQLPLAMLPQTFATGHVAQVRVHRAAFATLAAKLPRHRASLSYVSPTSVRESADVIHIYIYIDMYDMTLLYFVSGIIV